MTLTGDGIGGPPAKLRDASTVVLLRNANRGLETFMMCRHKKSGFMGGVHVFPGGKLDAQDMTDALVGRVHNVTPEQIAHALNEPTEPTRAAGLLVAAVRETFEEAGVLLGSVQNRALVEEARDALNQKAPFPQLADQLGLQIDGALLQPYARWITPTIEKRRFDTRFFLAVLPEGQQATHDGNETTSAQWLSPQDAIQNMTTGGIKLAPPTLRTLQWLTGFEVADEAIADAASRPPPLVDPHVVTFGKDGWFLALPGDEAHPRDDRALDGATRLTFVDGHWVDAT